MGQEDFVAPIVSAPISAFDVGGKHNHHA